MWDMDIGDALRPRDSSTPYVSIATLATPTTPGATDDAVQHCPSYKLPAYGIIEIAPDHRVTLTAAAVFRPQCTSAAQGIDMGGEITVADTRDPFHASITPQAYATGAATVIAWMLVIMLIITPRTFHAGNASGHSGLMGRRRGIISGASGGGSVIGVGSRPWLQKVAALTVALSLTLATADTFKIAARQYNDGFIDAMDLRDEVVASMEIRVSRVISDVFIWLAQVQTLIRLFPRHKEKVMIKWVGFALILLDITFSSLNSFGPYDNNSRPTHFDTAIPALSYLFQLSLSMLYAAWVMYYAITKRRYAFYHAMMWNMTVVASLSIIAILTPVVFFITDIANDTIAGWGDYFRWVGAAAASVIVWEWVERIEVLEREERKDGILGREVYDGDDMLDTTPSTISSHWSHKVSEKGKRKSGGGGGGGGGGLAAFTSARKAHLAHVTEKLGRRFNDSPNAEARKERTIHIPVPAPVHRRSDSANHGEQGSRPGMHASMPPPVPVISSPVSRTDTTSADSTVYTVRYHPISITPPIRQSAPSKNQDALDPARANPQGAFGRSANPDDPEKGGELASDSMSNKSRWQAVTSTFRRKGRSPPPELQRGRVIEPLGVEDVTVHIPPRNYTGLALSDRLGTFAAQQGERFRSKKKSGQLSDMDFPVTVIPAQPRGQTWSPEIIQRQQQARQEEISAHAGIQIARVPTSVEEEEEEEESHMPSPAPTSQTIGFSDQLSSNSILGTPCTPRTPRMHFMPLDAEMATDDENMTPGQATPGKHQR